jgi:hypothetical protein
VRALQELEPALTAELARLAQEHRERMDRELFLRLREIFSRILRELNDLDNPLRASVAEPAGAPRPGAIAEQPVAGQRRPHGGAGGEGAFLREADPDAAGVLRQRHRPAPAWRVLPFAEERRHLRSEFDADTRVVLVNELHPDYRAARDDGAAALDYLMMLTAKELALWQNPPTDALAAAEDMIRILARARRYLPVRG